MFRDPQAQVNSKSGNVVCDNIRIREDMILSGVVRGRTELDILRFQNDSVMEKDLTVLGDFYVDGNIFTGVDPVLIKQVDVAAAGGVLTLTTGGPWAFAENITGQIVIEADCLCLNLNSYTLDANGLVNGIVISGRKDVIVMNGCLTGALGATSAEIVVTGSTNVKLVGLNFDGVSVGERVVLFDTCKNISMTDCDVRNYLSTSTAVVQFEAPNGFVMRDVNVTECTKTLAAPSGVYPVGFFNVATRLISANGGSNFAFTRVRVNNNVSNSVQATNAFECIGFFGTTNGFFNQCETNNNNIVDGGYPGAAIMSLPGCVNVLVTNHQCNNNTCQGPINYFLGMSSFQSNGVIFDRCQSNNNIISELIITPGTPAPVIAIGMFFGSGNVIKNCQASNNRVDDPGARPGSNQFAWLIGINSDRNTIVENCEVCNNTIVGNNVWTLLTGLNTELGNCSISNCIVNENTGGEISAGILINTATPFGSFDSSDVTIFKCTVNANGNYGVIVGNPFVTLLGSVNRLQIFDSTFNSNGGSNSNTAGFKFLPLTTNVTDVIIKDCSINNTFASAGSAVGIDIPNASNIIIQNTIINSTNASGTGHAISLTTVANTFIEGCNLTKNQNSAVKLLGTCSDISVIESSMTKNDIGLDFDATSIITNSTVQSCQALNNTTTGFNYGPAVAGASFIGNKAQGNGTNYAIASGVINLQQLTIGTGTYTSISGAGAVLGSSVANLQIVP